MDGMNTDKAASTKGYDEEYCLYGSKRGEKHLLHYTPCIAPKQQSVDGLLSCFLEGWEYVN